MRKFLLCFLTFVLAVSCSGKFLSQQQSGPSSGPSSYCGLLNLPSGPHPVMLPKPYLGVYLSFRNQEQSTLPCKENVFIEVAGVIDATPAAEAGLREGDVILSFNGSPTCNDRQTITSAFKAMVEQQEIGSPIVLDILRNGQTLSLTVKLSAMPTHNQQEADHPAIGMCPDEHSTLESALSAQSAYPAFNMIVNGLYEKSNIVHNPGMAYEKESHPLQLKEVTYIMRHPLAAGVVAKELSGQLVAPLREGNWNIGGVVQRAAGLLDVDSVSSKKPAEISFPALLRIMEETKNNVEAALSNLTPEEKALLQETSLHPWEDKRWNDILTISLKIDRTKLMKAFSPLLSFLTRDNLSLLKEDLISRFGRNKGPVLYEATTAIGKVIVGGPGPNVYTEDAALILDLGGDDLYLNNAAGTRPGIPVALVIDWGGNDRYISKENFSQGAGVLGGGFLIDLGGDDTFVSLDGSQGAGFWGIGVLFHGNGNSTYTARRYCQGVGQMGIGLLLNGRGDDRYLCALGGQGLGLFGGAGVLIDEAGNDFYQLGGLEADFRDPLRSTVSMGQGFGQGIRSEKGVEGVPGGIGILIDEGGDDTYIADYFAQGASYYYGLGILDDRNGDDRYIAGRYAQGAGIHSSVGVLIDRKGNDFYYASFGVAQGMGHDFGVGFLEDDEGNDQYWGGSLVQGAATYGSLGIFIDLQGNDQYTYLGKGQAYSEEEKGMGIMIRKAPGDGSPDGGPGAIAIKIGVKKE